MGYFEDAKKLTAHGRGSLGRIEALYREALEEGQVTDTLVIGIKNLLENLRSALDYAAHGLLERHGAFPANPRQVQFPYTTASQGRAEFDREMERRLPGVAAARPDIAARLASYQHFANRFGDLVFWLPSFMELTNEKKHRRLTPQSLKQVTWLTYKVKVPANTTVEIPFPFTEDGPGTMDVVTRPEFVFASSGTPVLPALRCAVAGVEHMVDELSQL